MEESQLSVSVKEEEEAVEEPDYTGMDRSEFDFLKLSSTASILEITGVFHNVRPMKAVIEFLDNPHGSVQLYQGDTCIVGAFYGPSDVRMSKELPHRAAVDVIYRPKITGNTKSAQLTGIDTQVEERGLENTVAVVLESSIHLQDDPGAGFNFVLQEYENDGCILSACINAAFISALDGSCSLRNMLAGVTVALVDTDTIIVDPSSSQLKNGYLGLITYAISNSGEVLHTHFQGKITSDVLPLCLKCAQVAVIEIFKFYEDIIRKKYMK